MTGRSVSLRALAVFLLMALVPTTSAHARRVPEPSPAPETAEAQGAEPGPAPAPEAPANDEYRAAVALALVEFQAGRWEEARALFMRAHGVEPNARTLRGIGMCAFELGDYVGAIIALSESLEHPARPLDAPQRAQVEALLAQALTFVGRVTLVIAPNASVTVDGHSPLVREGTILVNPGDHEVQVTADALVPATRRVHVTGGATVTVEIELDPPPTIVTAPERVRPHPVTVPAAIAYGAGGVGLALAVGFGARTIVLDRRHGDGCLARGECTEAALDRQDRSALTADIGIGVAIAGTTAGLLLQLLRTEPGSEDAAEPTATVGAAYDGRTGMAVVVGRF